VLHRVVKTKKRGARQDEGATEEAEPPEFSHFSGSLVAGFFAGTKSKQIVPR
jgi:hypothetical protein